MSKIRHKLTLPFTNVTVYEDYIYAVMNEGITVLPEYNSVLVELADKFFSNTPFVYITHRIHSYSVDPTIYLETSKIKNLQGFIVVDPNEKNLSSASIEKLFFNKPFVALTNLEEAIIYKDELLSR